MSQDLKTLPSSRTAGSGSKAWPKSGGGKHLRSGVKPVSLFVPRVLSLLQVETRVVYRNSSQVILGGGSTQGLCLRNEGHVFLFTMFNGCNNTAVG